TTAAPAPPALGARAGCLDGTAQTSPGCLRSSLLLSGIARTRAGNDFASDVLPGQASDHQRDARDQGQEAHGQGIDVALQASPPSVTGTVKALRRERTRRRSRPGRTGTSSRPAAAGTPRP